MTAAELYEIVKDVPREAWPKLLEWDGQCFEDKSVGCFPSDAIIESAFIGIMTAWLASNNRFPALHVWEDGHNPKASVFLYNRKSHEASSLVAALAAACKEASNGN